jgi:enoyl-CoA hydratase/carnithine racemase
LSSLRPDPPSCNGNGNGSGDGHGYGPEAWSRSWRHLRIDRRSLRHCRVSFDHPPVNAVTATTVAELAELVGLIEHDLDLNVVVFDSVDPHHYLAHHDGRDGPTGPPAWRDALARLSRAPVVSIAALRGRAGGAGSELVLACDLRFAARQSTRLGRLEVGPGGVPGDGPTARLARLVGQGRALEVLLVTDELDGPRAEQYGYINRLIADDRLDAEVDAIAVRLAGLDHDAIARTKASVGAA